MDLVGVGGAFHLHRGPNQERIPVTMVNAVFRAAALGRPTPSAR